MARVVEAWNHHPIPRRFFVFCLIFDRYLYRLPMKWQAIMFLPLCVCVCVCACEQNISRTGTLFSMGFAGISYQVSRKNPIDFG